MAILARLADHFILHPTNHRLPAPDKQRRVLRTPAGAVEVWVRRCGTAGPTDLYVLKFPGKRGRAERTTDHPGDVWPERSAEVWAVNPPGYGGSEGRACIGQMADYASAVFEQLMAVANAGPVLVTGSSLGAVTALYLAARYDVHGMLLRNPPPLRELIEGEYGWWNFGLSRLIARQVPEQLCCLRNAARAAAPAVFVTCGRDRTVPPDYQRRIIDAHRGEQRVLVLPEGDHGALIGEQQQSTYFAMLDWLHEQAVARSRAVAKASGGAAAN